MGKKDWLKSNADACIRCANCMAVCPVLRVTPLFPGPKQAGPGAERFRRDEDHPVDEWIDLCIGCKLCNLACSSGVPISELNLLAKAKYLDEKGRPLRDWLLSHISSFGRSGSLLSPIINRVLKNSFVKWFLDTFLKIEKDRELPPYQSPTFRVWFKKHRYMANLISPFSDKEEMKVRKVAYFYGCYTNTNDVDVGKATVQVLEANGLEVIVPPQQCCGIPMLGNGDFRGAKKLGVKNVVNLLKATRSGYDLIFSSTSCGHMIKHEYSNLLNIPDSDELSKKTFDLFYLLVLKQDLYQYSKFDCRYLLDLQVL